MEALFLITLVMIALVCMGYVRGDFDK